jgi:hypothetical protein
MLSPSLLPKASICALSRRFCTFSDSQAVKLVAELRELPVAH